MEEYLLFKIITEKEEGKKEEEEEDIFLPFQRKFLARFQSFSPHVDGGPQEMYSRT